MIAGTIPASTVGRSALSRAAGSPQGRISAAFARSVHVACGEGLLAICSDEIPNGPLNVIVPSASFGPLLGACASGAAVALNKAGITVGPWLVSLGSAREWRPPPWPAPAPATATRTVIEGIVRFARQHAPTEGLSRVVLGIQAIDRSGSGLEQALNRLAIPRVDRLAKWLTLQGPPAETAAPPPVELVGLGPGLTPSGDDVLGGVMLALHAGGDTSRLSALAASALDSAATRTTALARALLAEASTGAGDETIHDFISAVIEARADRAFISLERLATTGHTSGWDAAAGALLALQCVAIQAGASAPMPRTIGFLRPNIV